MKLQLLLKNQMDFWVSLAGLIILSPLFLIVAVLIKINSPGTVFFRQERMGLGGRIFKIIKFRTMKMGAENAPLSVAEIRKMEADGNDPRVTGIGRFLRKFEIDEAPQLINILRGEMSFVGPRPFNLHRIESNVLLKERASVKPGLTSLAFVMGDLNLSDKEILKYDLEYIEKNNLWLDFKVLFKTIFFILSGRSLSKKK